ncbi:rCG48990, partial [Rattus norvegicus]
MGFIICQHLPIHQHLRLLKPLQTQSPESSENIEGLWWKLYSKLEEVNAFGYLDPSTVTDNGLHDLVYESFYSLV